MSMRDTQNLYRRFGKFLASISNKDVKIPFGSELSRPTEKMSEQGIEHVYVVAKA